MNEVQANAVYDLLVQHAGARDEISDRARRMFVAATLDGCREYRFQGSLGFGGKFYVDARRWRVGCYPEDMTDERRAAIAACNTALAELYAKEMAV